MRDLDPRQMIEVLGGEVVIAAVTGGAVVGLGALGARQLDQFLQRFDRDEAGTTATIGTMPTRVIGEKLFFAS